MDNYVDFLNYCTKKYKVELLDDALTTHIFNGNTVYAVQKYGHGFTFLYDHQNSEILQCNTKGDIFCRFSLIQFDEKIDTFFDLLSDVWKEDENENR